jgi:hypothetical protein
VVQLVLLVPLELLGAKELLEHLEHKVPRVQLEPQDLEVTLDHKDSLDLQVLLDLLDSKDFKAIRVPQVIRVLLDNKVQLEALELQEPRDHLEPQVSLVLKVTLVHLDRLDNLELWAARDNVEMLDPRAVPGHQDCRDTQVQLETPD